jgi:hypothetical protein
MTSLCDGKRRGFFFYSISKIDVMKHFRKLSQDLPTAAEYLTFLTMWDYCTVHLNSVFGLYGKKLLFYLKEKMLNTLCSPNMPSERQCSLFQNIWKKLNHGQSYSRDWITPKNLTLLSLQRSPFQNICPSRKHMTHSSTWYKFFLAICTGAIRT